MKWVGYEKWISWSIGNIHNFPNANSYTQIITTCSNVSTAGSNEDGYYTDDYDNTALFVYVYVYLYMYTCLFLFVLLYTVY